MKRRIRLDSGPIEVQFFSPYQTGCLTPFDDAFKERLKNGDPPAVSNAAQGTMIRDWLIQVIADM